MGTSGGTGLSPGCRSLSRTRTARTSASCGRGRGREQLRRAGRGLRPVSPVLLSRFLSERVEVHVTCSGSDGETVILTQVCVTFKRFHSVVSCLRKREGAFVRSLLSMTRPRHPARPDVRTESTRVENSAPAGLAQRWSVGPRTGVLVLFPLGTRTKKKKEMQRPASQAGVSLAV